MISNLEKVQESRLTSSNGVKKKFNVSLGGLSKFVIHNVVFMYLFFLSDDVGSIVLLPYIIALKSQHGVVLGGRRNHDDNTSLYRHWYIVEAADIWDVILDSFNAGMLVWFILELNILPQQQKKSQVETFEKCHSSNSHYPACRHIIDESIEVHKNLE